MAAMRALRVGTTARSLAKILREIDLGAIQRSAEAPVRIAVGGEEGAAEAVAALLGRPPWVGRHQPGDRHPGEVVVWLGPPPPSGTPAPGGTPAFGGTPAGAVLVVLGENAPPGWVALPEITEKAIAERLAPALLAAAPESLRLPLARRLPPLRAAYARDLIDQTARSNAVFAASSGVAELIPVIGLPVALADMVILTKNQLVMAFKLALAAGKAGRPETVMKEVVSVLGGGFLFRQVARELVGLVPGWGLLPKVAVAYAGTLVIGRVVHLWASEGEVPPQEEVRRFYREALDQGRALAARIADRVRPRGRRPSLGRGPKERPHRLEPPPAADPDDPRA